MIKVHYNGNIVYSPSGNKKLDSKKAKKIGNKTKKFYLKYKHYRKIASAAAYMHDNKVNKVVFYTFTIQDNIKDNSITNPAFSYLIKRLKKSYGLHSYLWVAERQKRGAIHYHCLFDIPKIDYSILKQVWHDVGENYGIAISAKNSVSGSKNGSSVINSTDKAVKYLTKYIAKGINGKENQTFQGRVYAISHNINVKPVEVSHETAVNYVGAQTRTPAKMENCTILFCDLQPIAEDWHELKKESDHIKHTKFLRKVRKSLRATKHENNQYEVKKLRHLQAYPNGCNYSTKKYYYENLAFDFEFS